MSESIENNGHSSINRRNFLRRSSTMAAGGAALAGLGVEKFVHAASSDELKLALVGCGGRGSGAADQALGTSGDVKLVAMADAFRDRMDGSQKGLERKHGIKAQVKEENKEERAKKAEVNKAEREAKALAKAAKEKVSEAWSQLLDAESALAAAKTKLNQETVWIPLPTRTN